VRHANLIPAILIAALSLPLSAAAQYQITQSVVGSGGGVASGASNNIVGTVGQPLIGVTAGASNINEIGFWYQPGWILTGVPGTDLFPAVFSLGQNRPNPFNPVSVVSFDVPERARVTLTLYDVNGREVRTLADAEYEPGSYSVTLDAKGLPSGVYFYRMTSGRFQESRKLVLLK
jgi:hypothetical protein